MYKHILLPTDGSELSEKAILKAIDFAKSINAKVTGFFAAEDYQVMAMNEYIAPEILDPEQFNEQAENTAKKYLSVIENAAKKAGVDYEGCFVTSNSPYRAIVDAATQKGCDLIFMASHGKRNINNFFLGSEANKVLTHCKIPILIYR